MKNPFRDFDSAPEVIRIPERRQIAAYIVTTRAIAAGGESSQRNGSQVFF